MKTILTVSLLFLSSFLFAQDCDCQKNFDWVKSTFEKNDAGFEYVLKTKGQQAYQDHNSRFLAQVKQAGTLTECTTLLYKWLEFFRSGHIAIRLTEQVNATANQNVSTSTPNVSFEDWEKYSTPLDEFKNYLSKKKKQDYEGIWYTEPYTIGIKKVGNEYKGFIIESGADTWTKDQVKLKFSFENTKANAVFYMRDHSAVNADEVSLLGFNTLKIGSFLLIRKYPVVEDDVKYKSYFKTIKASEPYLEILNDKTIYLRIPSFNQTQKRKIDSVLVANQAKILSTENFIIDIRNGTGGSDGSYYGLLPFLYTNPIRTVGVEFLSTPLNNQRMLDFINKPEYGFDEDGKKWAQRSYDKLKENLGQFVSLNTYPVSFTKFDSVSVYPKNVGIIINSGNGSTDEQFLLAAKQSKKVKLFGTTTHGVLDISNMYFVPSPCGKFELGYSLSRSMRIPQFTIDEKGIQPDYFLDKSIPEEEWTSFVNEILNNDFSRYESKK